MSSGLAFDENYTVTGGVTQMLFNSNDTAAVAANSPLEATPGCVVVHINYDSVCLHG